MVKITQAQIAQWKKDNGTVFKVEIEDAVCYLKKPDRKTLSFAMTDAQTNPLGFAEVILENCWLGGDEIIKTNDDYFMAASGVIDELIEIKQAAIKKI